MRPFIVPPACPPHASPWGLIKLSELSSQAGVPHGQWGMRQPREGRRTTSTLSRGPRPWPRPWPRPHPMGQSALTQELLVLLDLGADVRQPSGLLRPHSHTVGHALHLLDGLEPGEGAVRALRQASTPFPAHQPRGWPRPPTFASARRAGPA